MISIKYQVLGIIHADYSDLFYTATVNTKYLIPNT